MLKGKKALAFDPNYINKTGKHTDGVGYFWSMGARVRRT
jgi:hypothetical protein